MSMNRNEAEDALYKAKEIYRNHIREVEESYANLLSDINDVIDLDYSVGDKIKIETRKHKGKLLEVTKRGVVRDIMWRTITGDMVGYEGFILKKDGARSKYTHTICAKKHRELK